MPNKEILQERRSWKDLGIDSVGKAIVQYAKRYEEISQLLSKYLSKRSIQSTYLKKIN